MSAPAGNKYAEKWTLEKTLHALRTIDSYSCSSDCLYLNHALMVAGYYEDAWAYWRRKWRNQYEVIDMMKRILQRFEVRIFEKMANKEMPANVGMFALRHHYGWGRDPRDKAFEDDSYVDKELIPEPQPEIATEPTPDQPEAQQPETQTPAKPLTGQEYNRMKVHQYNAAHPTDPIIRPAAYFDGSPPKGLPAILFEEGYFLTVGT